MDGREYKKACRRKGRLSFVCKYLFLFIDNHAYVSPFIKTFFHNKLYLKFRYKLSTVCCTLMSYAFVWPIISVFFIASEQVSDMLEKISYPTEILKSHFLDQYYSQVNQDILSSFSFCIYKYFYG